MKVDLVLITRARIIFDDIFCYEMEDNINHSLQDYIDKANYLMNKYGFETAIIIDFDNEEALAKIEWGNP